MNVTVIGGSGFLGSHVADQLSEAGYQVLVFDWKKSPWLREDQDIQIGDIRDDKALGDAIKGADAVYHFAALADLNEALDKPVETTQINILGTVLVLEACRKYDVKRLVYASTVYVNSAEGGFYRCSKQAAENYIEEYQRVFGLDYTILRYGSLYGPRSDHTNGLFRIVSSAIENGKIRYEGSPEAIREYIHVEDAARASVTALESDFTNKSVVLTGRESISVHDLLKMLAEILNMPNNLEFIDAHHTGHYVRTPYSYQPKLGLKYTPPLHVDLGQGLLQLIHYIQQHYE